MPTLTGTEFERIGKIAKDRWGLHLPEKKMTMVGSRLQSFLRKSEFADVDAYLSHLETNATDEDRLVFFDILSTNVTSFFRDYPHFEFLDRELFTPLARGTLALPGKKLRMWSAGCSRGPEPYSLAMAATEHVNKDSGWDVGVLATDLSNSALEVAQAGVFPEDMVEDVPADMKRRCLLRGSGESAGMVKVAPDIRKLVTVRQLNLMDEWPMRGPFHVIFCRNVMIYFDRETRQRLIDRFYKLLAPGGVFAVGSSETLSGLDTEFEIRQPNVYVK